jgi:LacI family transcriptional regulator
MAYLKQPADLMKASGKVLLASCDSSHRRVAVLVDTSTTWGRAVLRGINSYRLRNEPWEIFVEARGLEERLRVPPGWRGAGVIARVNTPEMARELKALRIPVVNVSGIAIPEADFPRVTTDLPASARLAATHLLERGFKHFAYFGLIGLEYVNAHRTVFSELVKKAGGDFHSLAVKPMAGAEPDWRLDLASLGAWIKTLPRPVAVLCWNASSAREIVFACQEAGLLVPEEVAVLSQANDEVLCETSIVPISGVAVSGEGIGMEAARVLDGLMRGRQAPRKPILIAPLGIVTRQSTDILAIGDPAVAKALSFLRQNSSEHIRVEDVARYAGVSRRVLERRFVELLDRTPADEIRRVRLERARQLLVETDMPLSQVAEVAGFSSQAYFSDLFRRQAGIAPIQYRRKFQVRSKGFD